MSYYSPTPPRPDPDLDPEEPATGLQVGQSRTEGTVEVCRAFEDVYVVECKACGWLQVRTSVNGANWDTFTHNRTRRKSGCPDHPTRDKV